MLEISRIPVLVLCASCFMLNSVLVAAEEDIRTERVTFKRGATGTVIKNRIKGYEMVDYVLRGAAEQRMMVVLETDNSSNYFNVMAPGADRALYIGSTSGNRFEGKLPTSGDYTIRVYLMRNAARRSEAASYSLAVDIFGPGSSVQTPQKDFADGFGGGPDFWGVAGVADGDSLNLREGPSTQSRILSHLANGEVLRNRGCKMAGGQRWCKVESAETNGPTGWVAGRYLREAAGPALDATVSTSQVRGSGQPFHATGEVPCSVMAGQPTRSCSFGVVRHGNGNAGVWIKTNDRAERHIVFENGIPVSSDSPSALSFEKSADLFLIRIGNEERYEIPDAVVFGG